MSPELKDQIAAAAVLITDAKQQPDNVHALIEALCDQAHHEGVMAGLDKGQALIDKHLGRILEVV